MTLWIPYFSTKNALHHKIGRNSTRVFSCRFFSRGFLDLSKTLKTQRQKSLSLYKSDFPWQSNAFLWFYFQTHGFSYQCKEIKIGVMFSSLRKAKKKKITTRGLFISTLSHVKLIAETRHYTCYKNMKSMGIFFTVFGKFSRKNI